MCLNSVGNILKRCDTENREWWWRQIKQIYIYIYGTQRWWLRVFTVVIVKMLDLIRLLSEIKSYVVQLSFYIKMIKQRTSQTCNLKHSIKKDMFSVQGNVNLFKSGRGGEPSPYPPTPAYPPWLRVGIIQYLTLFISNFEHFLDRQIHR